MKKFCFLLLTATCFYSTGFAQTKPANQIKREPTPRPISPLNENTIVKDSAGNVVPYKTWFDMAKTGNWGLRTGRTGPQDVFTLYRITVEEQQARRATQSNLSTTSLPGAANSLSGVPTTVRTVEVITRYAPEASPKFDESTIVKDTAGNILPYAEWTKQRASGEYLMRSNDYKPEDRDKPHTYTLIKMSQQQKDAIYSRMTPPNESNFFKNGTKIDPIKVTDMNGKSINMKKLAGKIIVMNFWFIGCPPCRAEIPELNKLVAEYANNPNVVFIAIALDKRYELKKFLAENPYNYQIVDDGRYYADGYGVNLYPTNVVVDKTGTIKFNSSGFGATTPYWIKKTITESLAAN